MYGAKATSEGAGRAGEAPRAGPPRFRAAAWLLTVATITGLGLSLTAGGGIDAAELAPWLVLCLAADAMTVDLWRDVHFTMGLPVLLACGMSLGPFAAGLVGFLGCFDRREFRREIGLARALSNRSQVAVSAAAGAVVYQWLDGDLMRWPWVLAAACAALVVQGGLNACFVSGFAGLLYGEHPGTVARRLVLGRPREFTLTYACYGGLALLLGCSYRSMGAWGLLICAAPVFLAGRMLAHATRLVEASHALEASRRLLAEVSDQMASERTEERRQIASSLHDDVLASLHHLILHAQVIREDLRHGRLFQLEEDIPVLVRSCVETADLTRSVVTQLRASPLGRGGVGPALEALANELGESFDGIISCRVEEIGGDEAHHTLIYQIGREALRNAVRHSAAGRIEVMLTAESRGIRLRVHDDGRGFRADQGCPEGHFGVALMRERAGIAGGELTIASAPGRGTTVEAWFPGGRGPRGV